MKKPSRQTYILTAISLGLAWVPFTIFMNILSSVGTSPLSVRLPFGWTPDTYPLKCRQLQQLRYQGEKYIIEPGFPFKFVKSTNDALDAPTINEYCGDTPVISSNDLALFLDILLIFAPLGIAATLFVTQLFLRFREAKKTA